MPRTKTKKSTVKRISKRETSPKLEVVQTVTIGKKEFNRKKVLLGGALIILAGVLSVYAYKALVVAWVDKTPITRIELYRQLETRYGREMTDQIITETLIQNEAKERKVSVSDEDVNAEIKKLEDQQGGGDKLDQILSFQGISRDQLTKQIWYQLLIKKMFGEGVVVSDEEVNKYIEENQENLGEVDEKLRQAVKEQLLMQKIGQSFNTWLTENKNSSRVTRMY